MFHPSWWYHLNTSLGQDPSLAASEDTKVKGQEPRSYRISTKPLTMEIEMKSPLLVCLWFATRIRPSLLNVLNDSSIDVLVARLATCLIATYDCPMNPASV